MIKAKNRFSFLKMQRGADELGKFSYLGQIYLKIALKWPQWPGLYTTYEVTCTLTGLLYEILAKNQFFDWPPGPQITKTSNLG